MGFEALDRSATRIGYSEWGAVVQIYLTCGFYSPTGLTKSNLTQTYDYIPSTISWANLYTFLATKFLARDKDNRASLWWGESVLSDYYGYLTRTMQDIRYNTTDYGEPDIRKGIIFFTSNNSSVTDIECPQLFNINSSFMVDVGDGNFDTINPGTAATLTALDRD
ncbi:hypothetical protein BGW36DRAFT_442140 [Talaromyces proteolyticus]|uniref:Uncharacterized protein n=1 Tax=Talaromyces proteolyticus TaxID=1131652 RepID=A0AAD4PU71_9EURO|nr:uncharacterized protein BGW36DRAFT_442140 [Talaromyces proteolyticus]KAH8689000.1 hypothetical protein BGW36DRAFT_442140 [Talaromyces proteolyticus]